ncbi:hypothetical protein BWQ96_01907 [Gracilariopsis chorda]|uniref:High light inducible protein n=1 Tax=Gracilariopsis chorda TaxID=448386 RepID=A0A2V3IL20_9FLOR|nr:hypothetical protein BWQ96_07505 [Gracilariopsis chorda]PXF48218.1 hypothetical protein BWQ96_01907 [Gracilariopsis chorda]|eukprot:PXF42753.1 hypothetical protein BWQ96_07505 [Gracilariopsis chorda]
MACETAFVSSFAPSAPITTSPFRPARSSHRVATFSAAPRMALGTKSPDKEKSTFTSIEDNRVAKLESEYRGPQGFTPYAEKVNGRLAQMGFLIGLITEIITGKGINEQILIMFSPLTRLLFGH